MRVRACGSRYRSHNPRARQICRDALPDRAELSSETEAASLLRRIGGGMGERARQLAYLLYGICDRRRWSDEAGSYNMLVTAWPEIERLAASVSDATPAEQLF